VAIIFIHDASPNGNVSKTPAHSVSKNFNILKICIKIDVIIHFLLFIKNG
jgi:hypothetical protein